MNGGSIAASKAGLISVRPAALAKSGGRRCCSLCPICCHSPTHRGVLLVAVACGYIEWSDPVDWRREVSQLEPRQSIGDIDLARPGGGYRARFENVHV